MERNILVDLGIQKINKPEQFEILNQCTYRKWLYVADEKGQKMKYYAILLSQRPLKINSGPSSLIHFTGKLTHFINFNVLYLSRSFDLVLQKPGPSFKYEIPIYKSEFSINIFGDAKSIIIEYNQFRLTLLGETNEDTDELENILRLSFETSKHVEKSFKNNCINTLYITQQYMSMGSEQFMTNTTKEFTSMLDFKGPWEFFNNFLIDFKRAKKYFFNCLEGMLCDVNQFNIEIYKAFANIGLPCLMTKMEEFWENQDHSKSSTWADTLAFLNYLTKFNRKLKQFYLYDEKIENSFTNLLITSIISQPIEEVNKLNKIIEIQIKLSKLIQKDKLEVYQLQYPSQIIDFVKEYIKGNIDTYEKSKENCLGVNEEIIFQSLFQRSLFIIQEYINRMKSFLTNEIANEIIIAIINQHANLREVIKDLREYIESFKVLKRDMINKITDDSKINKNIKSLRKLCEAKYFKTQLENFKITKMNQPFEKIEIGNLLIEGTEIFEEQLNHYFSATASLHVKLSFLKQISDYYVYLTILDILDSTKNSKSFIDIIQKPNGNIKTYYCKILENGKSTIFKNWNFLMQLIYAKDRDSVIQAGVKVITLLKENSDNDISIYQISILLNCMPNRGIIDFEKIIEDIKMEKHKLENKSINPLMNKAEDQLSFSFSKQTSNEKFELENNEVKILKEKEAKFLNAEAQLEEYEYAPSLFGNREIKKITKFNIKLTYETLNFYLNKQPSEISPVKFIDLLDIKEIKPNSENGIRKIKIFTSNKTGTNVNYQMEIISSMPFQEWVYEIMARAKISKNPKPIKWNDLISFKMVKKSDQFYFNAVK